MAQWNTFIATVIAGSTLLLAAAKEDNAVLKRVLEFQEAMNRQDARALAGFWTQEGDLISPSGAVASGPAEIEKLYEADFENFLLGATSTFTIQKIRFLKPDLCIVNMTHDFTGGKLPDGTPMTPGRALVTGVASKQGGNWMREAARPMIP
jgi:uncharacterized protein (TIGR02246 family)